MCLKRRRFCVKGRKTCLRSECRPFPDHGHVNLGKGDRQIAGALHDFWSCLGNARHRQDPGKLPPRLRVQLSTLSHDPIDGSAGDH